MIIKFDWRHFMKEEAFFYSNWFLSGRSASSSVLCQIIIQIGYILRFHIIDLQVSFGRFENRQQFSTIVVNLIEANCRFFGKKFVNNKKTQLLAIYNIQSKHRGRGC